MSPLVLFVLLREDFSPTWDRVASAIRTDYYARRTRHDEMERLLAKTAPLARSAPTRAAFASVVNAMIAAFGDSHFEFTTPRDQAYYLMDALAQGDKAATMPQIGAWFRKDADGYTVSMILDGSAAERAGLRVGDRVTRVDGKPFSPVDGFKGDVGRNARLTYRRDGREAEADVAVARTTALRMFLDATLASRRVVERGGKRFGVFHLWTQTTHDFEWALVGALVASRTLDGFVLDLRAGFGGHVEGFTEAFGKGEYEGPLVVVVDRGSRSAKEVLSYQLQRSGRATIVGETTAGDVLGASPRRIEDWAYLELPVEDVVVGGVRLEGRGVVPDVAVPPGEDPIDRAVGILARPRIRV